MTARPGRQLPCARPSHGASRREPWWFTRDRGGQFRSRNFRAVLKANDLTGSMGRVSSAGDNAAMESFYSLLQKNVLDRRRWRTRDELAYEIIYWIEHTYNRRRRQRGLGKLTPVEFELAFTEPVARCGLTTKPPSTKLRADPFVGTIDCSHSTPGPKVCVESGGDRKRKVPEVGRKGRWWLRVSTMVTTQEFGCRTAMPSKTPISLAARERLRDHQAASREGGGSVFKCNRSTRHCFGSQSGGSGRTGPSGGSCERRSCCSCYRSS